MKPTNQRLLKWELARERLRIEERFPPKERRTEKCIRDILAGILNTEDSNSVYLPEIIREHWPMIAGEQLAKHISPAHLKNGILYLYADHPGWLAQIRRLPKMHLLKKIAVIPDSPEVTDLRFQLDPSIQTFRK
jgi:hypothetical protein